MFKNDVFIRKRVRYKLKSSKTTECKNKKSLQMDKLNDYVLDFVKQTVSNSHLFKEKFKVGPAERGSLAVK